MHEVYAAMAEREGLAFPDRARFLGYAARAMRGFIVDALRSGSARKRGGEFWIGPLDTGAWESLSAAQAAEVRRLSDALDGLAQLEPELARLVDLRFFCGFSVAEIAGLTGASERSVERNWEKARLLLFDALREGA